MNKKRFFPYAQVPVLHPIGKESTATDPAPRRGVAQELGDSHALPLQSSIQGTRSVIELDRSSETLLGISNLLPLFASINIGLGWRARLTLGCPEDDVINYLAIRPRSGSHVLLPVCSTRHNVRHKEELVTFHVTFT